ncbi:MAG TPA: thioredoxin fold domain-containing protein [Castellaniella sp.]|uniref:thioredoxin fold domain-containing protein n=1 Tax=Castellaniella sp. TaxID=1955812 RepID=UPI002F03CD62
MKHAVFGRLSARFAIGVVSAALVAAAGLVQVTPVFAAETSTGSQADASTTSPKVQALWGQVTQSKYIIQGASDSTKKATIYAFFDPNCIFCHLSWKLSRAYYPEGLQVRWIPVAFLMTSSAPRAAWVLLNADPSKAMADGEGGWKGLEDGGGAFKEGPVTAEVQKTLARNKKLFMDLGLTGTPGFVYKDPVGIVHTVSGVSSKHMFANMTGLPYVSVDDPDLDNIPD